MGAWQKFKAQRMGYISLWILLLLFGLSLCAELLSNDKPLLAHYQDKNGQGQTYAPIFHNPPETAFGGDFYTPTDYLDPFIQQQFAQDGNWLIFPPNRYHYSSIHYFAKLPNPAPPSADNWLGTDAQGRDVLARLLYGFRLSVLMALAVTIITTLVGAALGALQGYFGGKVDLLGQRAEEVWRSMPELYLFIIFASVFSRSVGLLLLLLTVFGWMGVSAYMRAEYLRNRNLDYVRAAQALGVGHGRIIFTHILPNALVPIITLLPFKMIAVIMSLTALDFLGLGLPPGAPSLGELLGQAKANLDAWWIGLSTVLVLMATLLLLTLVGDALRNALDPRRAVAKQV
jgi:microcin C transport system permease protein